MYVPTKMSINLLIYHVSLTMRKSRPNITFNANNECSTILNKLIVFLKHFIYC